MEINQDFVAIIIQFALNFLILVGLTTYILCTYSWESNAQQEDEAVKQFIQMQASLNKKPTDDNSGMESLIPRNQSLGLSGFMDQTFLNNLTAIAPNKTSAGNANSRFVQKRLMESANNSSIGKHYFGLA